MATLKCLACGHDNKVGDESCSSCSSSLNLKLCSACEAINAHSAERCHGCNADFRAEAEAAALEAEPRPRGGELHEAPFVYKALPAAWRAAAQEARKRSTRVTVGLWLLPLAALGLGYYSYGALQKSDAVPAAQAARESRIPAKAEAAPREIARPQELARPQTVEVRQTPAPAVSGKLAPPKSAPAPLARNTPVPEPRRVTSSVTHTRAGAAALPVAAATPLPAAGATAVLSQPAATSVTEVPAATAQRRHAPVTHTKAVLTEAAATTTVPAAASEGRSAQAETRSDEPAGCAPAVVALGLCKSK